jgi:hypothetical protein
MLSRKGETNNILIQALHRQEIADLLSKLQFVPVSQEYRAKKLQDTGFCDMPPPRHLYIFSIWELNDPMCCAAGILELIYTISFC